QIGLPSGAYTVQAEKEKLASAPATINVRSGIQAKMDLVLGAASAAATKEGQAKAAELKRLFDAAVADANAGNHDSAIAKFQQAIVISPNCNDCYDNIGYAYMQKKELDKSEEAYKKAAEIKPDDPTAWSGLANVYNAERKFDLATQAGAKAAELSGGAAAAG